MVRGHVTCWAMKRHPASDMKRTTSKIVLWAIALFYLYGATVHVLNMLSLMDFDWPSAPLKWQVLDVVYLVIDLIVVVALPRRWRTGIVAFFLAATSQIVLYTVLRSWITDVPEPFAVSAEQMSYLTGLVVFHLLSLIAVSWALRQKHD